MILNLDSTQSLTFTSLPSESQSVPETGWRLRWYNLCKTLIPHLNVVPLHSLKPWESPSVLTPHRALSELDLTVIGSSQKLRESWGQPREVSKAETLSTDVDESQLWAMGKVFQVTLSRANWHQCELIIHFYQDSQWTLKKLLTEKCYMNRSHRVWTGKAGNCPSYQTGMGQKIIRFTDHLLIMVDKL